MPTESRPNLVPFDKYDRFGAYHWMECERHSRRYNPPLVARYEAVAKRISGRPKALDIGCGDGYLMHLIQSQCDTLVGIDTASAGVRHAAQYLSNQPRTNAAHCPIALGSGYELPFADKQFDLVLMTDVIEHLERPESCLAEICRVLQPDGLLYVTTPRRRPERPLGWGHVREYTGDELKACLETFFVQVHLTYLWPITWFRLYGTRLEWRLIRLFARYVGNPFTREGQDPEQFAQILAMCHRPTPPMCFRIREFGMIYPLQQRLLVWGLAAVGTGLAMFWSAPMVGMAWGVLLVIVGMVWRAGESPTLAFCLGYQWCFIATGYIYQQITGAYPALEHVAHIEIAVGLSLLGLLTLVAGIRLGISALHRHGPGAPQSLPNASAIYPIQRLFWWVIGLYSLNWFVRLTPMTLYFDAAQVIYNLLALRTIFFALLFFNILQAQTGYSYAAAAFIYVLLPQFASMMSHFKESFFVLSIALLGQWRPWQPASDNPRHVRLLGIVLAFGIALLSMAIFWEGGIKPIWRPAMIRGQVTGSPLQKINAFIDVVQTASQHIDVRQATEDLASRMASGVGYFSHVLERVPTLLDYEHGRLTWRAIAHLIQPRFLFPNKPNLGGDSWLVRKYAGIHVADERQSTSVGLSYMAQFYIDFGVPGMFVPLFLYGLLLGLIYQSIRLAAPSPLFFQSTAMVIFLQHFMSYEGEIAKLLGGLI